MYIVESSRNGSTDGSNVLIISAFLCDDLRRFFSTRWQRWLHSVLNYDQKNGVLWLASVIWAALGWGRQSKHITDSHFIQSINTNTLHSRPVEPMNH